MEAILAGITALRIRGVMNNGGDKSDFTYWKNSKSLEYYIKMKSGRMWRRWQIILLWSHDLPPL